MNLEDKIWFTRKARIQAEKRLLSNAKHSQLLMLWYSFCGVVVSIINIAVPDDSIFSSAIMPEVAWVSFAVLTLCMSVFISALSFKERAQLIKECYEALNSLQHRAKKAEELEDQKKIEDCYTEYERILGLCENHKDIDFYQSKIIDSLVANKNGDLHVSSQGPTKYHWFYVSKFYIIRGLMLFGLYILPVALMALVFLT